MVNFILKKEADGITVDYRYGQTERGDAESMRLNISGGFSRGNFNAVLGMEYREEYDREYIRSLLHGLAQLGASVCAITGVSFEEDKLGIVSYDSVSGEYFSYFRERCPGVFHGTGYHPAIFRG